MKDTPGTVPVKKPLSNLQTDIKQFAEGLPHWGKLLASIILSGRDITDAEIDNAYQALLEELKIISETKRDKIDIHFGSAAGMYHPELKFDELKETEGINALAEKQVLQMCGNLTILYGTNGSGKSGYARLLKKVFYSKSQEEILANIHLEKGHKRPSALFSFTAGDKKLVLRFPEDSTDPAFAQFSVFDGKAVHPHLDERNALTFRPAGLSFFSQYTDAVRKLETKLQGAVKIRQGNNPFPDIFEGDSDIKTIITGLSANTKIAELKKFLPFTEEDQKNKKKVEIDYDDLLVASKGKGKEIAQLETAKQSLLQIKTLIEKINKYFSDEALKKIRTVITDCLQKEKQAKQEGVENFKTEVIQEVGSAEWKNFITAASIFAQQQSQQKDYPTEGNHCLLCHQPLTEEANALIQKYWAFIKSEAEKKAAEAGNLLQQTRSQFDKLMFDLFPEGGVLTAWMTGKKATELVTLSAALNELKALKDSVVNDMDTKTATERKAMQVDTTVVDIITAGIDESIKAIKDDAHEKEMVKLLGVKTLFSHREKLQQRIAEIEKFVDQQIWVKKASKVSWGKRGITDTEKELSGKYFNQKYIDTFNEECKVLDGNFGIVINHTGAAGASYRQLTLRGKSPSTILSEGEQKVIAIADFIAEMRMSGINRGMVFDDPINSLDEHRKKRIAEHLAELSKMRQVIIFSHDLVFVSALITYSQESKITFDSHWIEKREDKVGMIFLNNSPSYEKEYRNNAIPMKYYVEGKKEDCPPAHREYLVKVGFTALRTCYEVLVINDLFKNVVQRFNDRVGVDSLKSVFFDQGLIDDLRDSFGLCCRYMEGHTHSDAYAYQRPELKNLKEEIDRYDSIKKKVKEMKKSAEIK